MKNYLLLILVVVFFSNCSKDNDDSLKSRLIGDWNWVKTYGGIATITQTPESTGWIITLEIDNDSIKKFVNGVLESKSNYSIKSENIDGKQVDIIYSDQNYGNIVSLNKDYLIFYEIADDGLQYEYVRE